MQDHDISRKQYFLICLALFLIGIPPRLHGLFESLWLDEALMAWRTEDLSSVFLTMDGSPPLFPFWVWSSRQLFGPEPWALRLPSLLFGSLLAPTIFTVLIGRIPLRWALFSSLLAVANPFSLTYSVEAKTYAACSLFALLSFGMLWRMMSQPYATSRWEGWAFFISTSFLPSLHHWGAFTLAGQGAVLAYWTQVTRPDWRRCKRFYSTVLSGWAAGTLGFLAQLPLTLEAKDAVKDAIQSPNWPRNGMFDTLTYVLGSHISLPAISHSVIVAACLLTLALTLMIIVSSTVQKADAQWAWMLTFTTLITLAVQAATYHFFHTRFEMAYTGIVLAFYGMALSTIKNIPIRTTILLLLIGMQVSAIGRYQKLLPRSISGPIAHKITQVKPQAVILALQAGFDPVLQAPLAYHLHRLNGDPVPLIEFPTLNPVTDAYYPPTSYYAQWGSLLDFNLYEVEHKLIEQLKGMNRIGVVAWPEQAETFNYLLRDWRIETVEEYKSRREGSVFLIVYFRPNNSPESSVQVLPNPNHPDRH